MSDDFEFDDNDEVLLGAICTPPSANLTTEKRLNEDKDEILPIKKPKRNDSERLSPIIQLSHQFSKEAKKKNSLTNTAKRIFPGPAGILTDESQSDILTQDSTLLFQEGPWQEVSTDYKISNSLFLYDKFNIGWIKKEATANKFVNQKAPFLAGTLVSLDVSEGHSQKSINITLKDVTGTIQGTILQNLYEEYESYITLGSVLVLIQFGVLSCTCDKCDNHHLTITPNNLCAIYSPKEKIVIKKVDPDVVLKEYYERKKELELTNKNRNLLRPNSFNNSPVLPSVNSNRCTYSKNISTKYQSPCKSGNSLLTNVGKALNNISFDLQKSKTIETISLEATVTKEPSITNSLSNSSDITLVKPKKVFTFRSVKSSQNSNSDLLNIKQANINSNNNTVGDSHSSLSKQKTVENVGQAIVNPAKESITMKDEKCVNIGKNQLKVNRIEHESIWKDALQDLDVNSFFDDDF